MFVLGVKVKLFGLLPLGPLSNKRVLRALLACGFGRRLMGRFIGTLSTIVTVVVVFDVVTNFLWGG